MRLSSAVAGLDDLELHHIVVNTWEHGVDSEQNVVLISIASVMDPSLAPTGKHTLHAYLPATEPFELWQDLKQGSPEYAQLKEERSQVLWKAVEKIIPDIRKRTEIEMVSAAVWLARVYALYVGLTCSQLPLCILVQHSPCRKNMLVTIMLMTGQASDLSVHICAS